MKRAVLVFLLVFLYVSTASATTFYVAKGADGGSDAHTCVQAQSVSQAMLTVNVGVDCLSAGDTLEIRRGTYDESLNDEVPAGSDSTHYTKIHAYAGETVILRPTAGPGTHAHVMRIASPKQYIEFDGIDFDGWTYGVGFDTIKIDWNGVNATANHITIKNAEIWGPRNFAIEDGQFGSNSVGYNAILVSGKFTPATGGNEFTNLIIHDGGDRVGTVSGALTRGDRGAYGIYITTDDNIVSGNDISDVSEVGIHIYSDPPGNPSRNVVKNSKIHDITDTSPSDLRIKGLLLSGPDNRAESNQIYGMGSTDFSRGIDCFSGNCLIYNNTVADNALTGIFIGSSASGAIVRGNIAWDNGLIDYDNSGSGTTQNNNLCNVAACAISSDPLFNVGVNVYTLQAGSPALDVAPNLSSIFTTDFTGATRIVPWDLGAYDRAASSPPIQEIPAAAGAVVIAETFTGSAGANLTTKGFEKRSGYTTDAVITSSSRIRSDDTGAIRYYNTTPTISAEYDIATTFTVQSLIDSSYYLLLGRMDTTTETQYTCGYNVSDEVFSLGRWVNGSSVALGDSAVIPLSVSSTYDVVCQFRDGEQGIKVNGTPVLYRTDTTITDAGRAGLGWYTDGLADTDGTGIHIDAFTVTDVDAAPAVPSGTTGMPFGIRLRPAN